MNVKQEARDLLNTVSQERFGYSGFNPIDSRMDYRSVEAVCRALETRNEVQAKLEQSEKAFDAYRREVSDAIDAYFANRFRAHDQRKLISFIIPEPVDPLTATLDELGVDRADFDAALAAPHTPGELT